MASAGGDKGVMLKVVVLGDSGVGKTSLTQRWVKGRFSNKYKATIGADTMTKEVEVDGKRVTLLLWDTAGQERFQSLGVSFYRGSDACVLVYDITSEESFESLRNWQRDFVQSASSASSDAGSVPFVVLGNKSDMADNRRVSPTRARGWVEAELPNSKFFETSAKDATNVDEAFVGLARAALAIRASAAPPGIPVVPLNEPTGDDAHKKGCC